MWFCSHDLKPEAESIHRTDPANACHYTDPIIFRGLKSLTFANTQQSSLLRLASEGISVKSKDVAI